jgi:drug/metabolite transporter (DMT)-like permease
MWVAALFWGLNWPAIKIVLQSVPPWTLRAAGLGIGGLLIALTARLLGRSLAVPRAHWRTVAIAGLLNVAGFNICAVFAQLTMPASRAAIMTFTMPFWAVVFARVWLGERIDLLRAVSLVLGGSGLVLLTTPFWPLIRVGDIPFGLLFVLGAAITWAAGTVFLKRHPVPAEPLAVTVWQMAVAVLVCTAGMLAFETPSLDLSRTDVAIAFAYHCLLPQSLSYALWFGLIRHVTASTAALGTLLIPVFGVAGSVAVLGEAPTLTDYAGLALIVAGVGLDQGLRRPARGAGDTTGCPRRAAAAISDGGPAGPRLEDEER